MTGADETLRADYPLLTSVIAVASAELLSRSLHSRVYRVVDTAGNPFVLKLMHPEAAARAAYLGEALAGTPGLNQVLLSGSVSGFGYLVYEYRPRTLADLLAQWPIPVAEAVRLLTPVAHLVEALHRLGYVHGDLKPDNVLITASGATVLADLDEAVAVGALATRFTPGFAAPELAADAPAAATADYFGFAALVAATLSGLPAGRPDAQWLAQQAGLAAAALPPPAAAALVADLDPNPQRRVVAPTALLAALAEPVATTRHPDLPDARHELAAAVRRVFGEVDARTPTLDRLPLQVQPPHVPDAVSDGRRSVWRSPALITAAVAATMSVIITIVLLWS